MLRKRVIPALLLKNESLVKTKRFKDFVYIGDPCNTVRIFNELEVDELLFLDISASKENREPNYALLSDIASECFMPLSYGGGVRSIEQARKILGIGFEKISLNSIAIENPKLVNDISNEFGSQAVIASVDYKKRFLGGYEVVKGSNQKFVRKDIVEWAKELEYLGAGEILLTSVDNEGTWDGYDLDNLEKVCDAVSIPVIANGGCGNVMDIGRAVNEGKASAVALGSMVVFQKQGMGVLVNFPKVDIIETANKVAKAS